MAWAGIISGLLSAGGQVAGGLLGGQGGGGQGKTSSYNPALDYALQVAQYAALDPTGFGTINNIPDPYQQFIGRLQSAPMDNKTRRRAMSAIENIRKDSSLISDPNGTGFTQDQLRAALMRGEVPFGRVLARGGDGATSFGENDGIYAGFSGRLPVKNLGRLESALGSVGMSIDDLTELFRQEEEQKAQIARLKERGLGRLNEDTILNRAQANASAAALLGDAGRFATGAAPSEFQSGLLDRINRNIDEQEQQYLLRAQFGGFNPGSGMRDFQNMRQDSEITGLTQAVQAASALMGGLQGGTQGAQQAAQQSSGTSLGALGAAVNQAMAANQLGQNASINRSDSYANGASGAANSISQSMLLSQLFNQRSSAPATKMYGGTGTEQGFWLE